MNKAWLSAGAAAAAAVAAWAGSGVYIGVQFEQTLKELAAKPAETAFAWRMGDVEHIRGLFQSSGKLVAVYSPGRTADAGDGFAVEVNYSMNHLPLPAGAARFQWQLTPQSEATEAFETLFHSATALTGEGTVSMGGAVRSSMALPQVSMRSAGEVLDITPSKGSLEINGQALAMQWQIDRMVMRRDGQKAFDMQGLSIELDIYNRSKGTGSGSIKVANASASMGSLKGLVLEMEASEKGDRLNSRFTPSVRKMEGAGQTLSDLRMEWALDGLHTASVETLIKLFQDSRDMDALTAKEKQVAVDALETLIAKGFSFGMPTLSGKAADGSIQGSFVAELTAAAAPALAEQLRSSGKLEITGAAIPPEQRDMAVGTGFAVVEGETLSASYSYAKGLLKVNNRTMDARDFEDMLTKADEVMRTYLGELRN